jgi:hypothetical protein
MTTEGIFRVSGSSRRTRMLQSIFDTPESYGSQLDWRGYTVHDAANVMKRFLNFLPEPVVTLEYYRIFKDTARKYVLWYVFTSFFNHLYDSCRISRYR